MNTSFSFRQTIGCVVERPCGVSLLGLRSGRKPTHSHKHSSSHGFCLIFFLFSYYSASSLILILLLRSERTSICSFIHKTIKYLLKHDDHPLQSINNLRRKAKASLTSEVVLLPRSNCFLLRICYETCIRHIKTQLGDQITFKISLKQYLNLLCTYLSNIVATFPKNIRK